ncbi:8082_t:CDS:1 [Dentiscutata erythropus]|uniref:8082_t:CDS:1 n=1 Tax=Dentiscutata erythropus TaxID=1348616 RepID=A0A9N9A6X9_9GLOM|nr:8082_t:CDS:1 [Dentiscutata erythropus]
MFYSQKQKLTNHLINKGLSNRCYASAIQIPFHPHYVPPGQPFSRRYPTTRRKKFLKTSHVIPTFNLNSSQNQLQSPNLSEMLKPTNAIFIGIVPTVNKLQTDENLSRSYNINTQNEHIPIIFRVSTICFVLCGIIRYFYRTGGTLDSKPDSETKHKSDIHKNS